MSIATKDSDSKSSDFANQAEVSEQDSALLDSIVGREDQNGAEPGFLGADDTNRPLGATPQSVITGRHDDGTDANETVDGLSESEEMTRHLAEDIPTGAGDEEEDIPVFERGRTRTDILRD